AQCQECSAYVGGDASNDNLLPLCVLHRLAESGVVPGVDFTVAADDRRVFVHLEDFLWERAVWTRFGGSGKNGGEVEERAKSGMAANGVAEGNGLAVPSNLEEAGLVVDDEKSGFGFVNSRKTSSIGH